MSLKSANADKRWESNIFANNFHSVAGHARSGEPIGVSADRLSFSNRHLSQALEAERQEASHQLAILAKTIFVSVGC